MIITNIQSLSDVDRATVLNHFSKSSICESVGFIEAKKPRSNAGQATVHGDYTKKVVSEQKEAIAAFKLANPGIKAAHLVFTSNYKKEHMDEFAAFKAEWEVANPKPVSEVVKKERKASVSKAVAEPLAEPITLAQPITLAEPLAQPMAQPMAQPIAEPLVEPSAVLKKRGPKKLADMSPEERAAHEAKKADRRAKKENSDAEEKPSVDTDSDSVNLAPRPGSPKEKAE